MFGHAERVLRLAQLLLERANVGDAQQVAPVRFLLKDARRCDATQCDAMHCSNFNRLLGYTHFTLCIYLNSVDDCVRVELHENGGRVLFGAFAL